jgi:two-component system cell cycle response regulator
MRVLVAEDDVTSRTILTAILHKWGYEVVSAVDGEQALQLLQQPESPRLALLDWSMPGLSGIEVCSRLRVSQAHDSVYIIILTAKSEKKNIVEGLNAGANDYIVKPYDNDELQARINVGRRMVEIQSELESAKRALLHEVMYDSLTGVYNRKAILNHLKKELSRTIRTGGIIGIGMCDLDHFKKVNDKYGHQTGDEILKGFTRLVNANLREYDLIGRYGGEEFLIIIPSCGDPEKMMDFSRLCNVISASKIHTRSGELSITVSIGVTQSDGKDSVDKILNEADNALYKAKDIGRNCVCYA